MAQHPNSLTTDEEIDAALERAKAFAGCPTIIEAAYLAEAKVNCLMLRLSNGGRMLIPVEMLSELRNATPEQAANLAITNLGLAVWWPDLDDGLYLPDFLEHRWGKEWQASRPNLRRAHPELGKMAAQIQAEVMEAHEAEERELEAMRMEGEQEELAAE